MSGPKRIQRRRTKGWRMPEGAVYVGRPSKWGNPFTVMNGHRQGWLLWDDSDRLGWTDEVTSDGYIRSCQTKAQAVAMAVTNFGRVARAHFDAQSLAEIAGRDLVCWCPLDQPCHADVLLEIANQHTPPAPRRHPPRGRGNDVNTSCPVCGQILGMWDLCKHRNPVGMCCCKDDIEHAKSGYGPPWNTDPDDGDDAA